MPSVEDIEINVPPLPGDRGWNDGAYHTYPSPDGALYAEFRDPVEVSMCRYTWQFALMRAETGEPIRHPGLPAFEREGGIIDLCPYEPWDSQSQRVCLGNGRNALRLFDIPSQTTLSAACRGYPVSVVGSPSVPRFVVVGSAGPLLIDSSGEQVAVLFVPTMEYFTPPEFCWFRHGECVWCLSRPPLGVCPRITFFNGCTGEVVRRVSVDPNELVPYSTGQYQTISRDCYSLDLGRGTRCVGHFLDIWSAIKFDPLSGVLHLRTYRPTGPVYRRDDTDVCDVAEVWVRMRLKP